MSEYKLAAEPREATGKGPARRARRAGRVPAVLYGHGMAPQHLSVNARELEFAMRTEAGENVLLELRLGRRRQLALAKEIQRHPVRGSYVHVDFIAVRRGEKVTVNVPVQLVGEAPGVREGGVASQELRQVNLEAEVTNVPEAIEADVSGLGIGDVLRVGDLKAPEGTTILDSPEDPVVAVLTPTVEAEPTVEPTEAEAAGGEAATAGEAAEAPAGGGEGQQGG
jgi:large subunit ribosomal protein L25